jgi:hypothetical protein
MGGSATPARPTRTPASMSTHRTPMTKSTSRVREAPTPTHRATRSVNPLASSTSFIPSLQSTGRINPLACSTSSISSLAPPAYSLPRPGAMRVHTMPIRPLSTSVAHNVIQPRFATHNLMISGIPKMSSSTTTILSRDGTRRPRRESFKPRRSILARADTIRTNDSKQWRLEDFVEEF